ncbi:MAG: glycosyltransferase [Verrucomicrobiales bacterium]|nr:glycosyltransferase [Verrucomicrobiales bacterium]
MPTLSIVIPAYNEERLLPRTLEAVGRSLPAFTSRGWEAEVVVCDNNSTDRTSELAREWGAKVVFEPVNQIGRARNCGAAAARGDWLLFLDADSVPTPELFAAAEAVVAQGRVLFVGAVVELDASLPPVASFLLGSWNWLSRTLRWMAGSFILVEASAFREIGGFDLSLYASEELDLSRRLKSLARRTRRRGVILSHPALKSSARRMTMYRRGHLLFFLLKASVRPWSTVRSREACRMWYDGKRE